MTLPSRSLNPPAHTARPVKFVHTQASLLLDVVRSLAAFIVLTEHCRNIFFVNFSQLTKFKAGFFLPYLLVSAGHQAVVVFFVLSGYLISGSVFRLFREDRWSWRKYLLHRLLRLWIVLLPGIIITDVADRIGMSLRSPGAISLYSGHSGDHVVGVVFASSSFLTAVGNFFFLQGIKVFPFGSDGALWSLANEFWYYILFPLAFIALRRKSAPLTRLMHAALFLSTAFFVRHNILKGFPIWLLGTLLAAIRPPRLGAAVRWIAAPIYALIFYSFARVPQLQGGWADQVLGLVTFVFLWIILSANAQADENTLPARSTRLFARFSYTLYVAHTPILVLAAALILGSNRWQPDAPHIAVALGILVFVVGLCLLLASQTEFRTDAIRMAVERRLHLVV
jgi:peptidoglycan/LPS O-acetylase OafA/YrhL